SSNRTCGITASGFPTGFIVGHTVEAFGARDEDEARLSRIPLGGPHMAESGGGFTGCRGSHGGSSSCCCDGGAAPGLACARRFVGSGRSGSSPGDPALAG